jgi:hypothetical protein
MNTIEIDSQQDRYVISLDKNTINKDLLFEILERLEIEKLAQKVGFNDDILELGQEINNNWWKQNKGRFIKE